MESFPKIPTATYRLQFHAGFSFRDAREIAGYLHALGISDVYASPFFQAAEGSTHGYDITDHNRLNPDVGGRAEFREYVAELRHLGMGQILDFVPNHMGIGESVNSWWLDVLEEGMASPYAGYFDIDWEPGRAALSQRVILPILGDRYGRVLESGEIQATCEDGGFFVRYHDTRLPLSRASCGWILSMAEKELDSEKRDTLAGLRKKLAVLPLEEKAAWKQRLRAVMKDHSDVAAAITGVLEKLGGTAGDPASFDALHALLEQQSYRLGYWRSAVNEINYRRFFDISTLAAIRIEIPEVFEAAHRFVFELLHRGDVTGLRIDHIDGLWDPAEYLRRLQQRVSQLRGCRVQDMKPLYLVVEKILDPTKEQLPVNWKIHGTTGYDFTNQAVQLLVNSAAERKLTRFYGRFTGCAEAFEEVAYDKKRGAMETSLTSEISSLGRMLNEISEMHRDYRDFTRSMFTTVVREVIACFPVYRTYATPEGGLSSGDEKNILRAVSAARRRNPGIEKPVFDFLRNLLLMKFPEHLDDGQRAAHVRFVMKFQQCTGAVMAKGVEDAAFYVFNRLLALNEVGGHPGVFGITVKQFHKSARQRSKSHPHALLATSTHDTKRSEDVRLRIAAISELAGDWKVAVTRWSSLLKRSRRKIDGVRVPSANEEYLLYQTLVGSWPLAGTGDPEFASYADRIDQYMKKALKEAKTNSSWTEPNEEWEKAVSEFVAEALTNEEFLASFEPFAGRIAELGAMNSLTQTILKCTLPGVPDIYQGTETWDLSLVDPDNRRPVDYLQRRSMLDSLATGVARVGEMVADWQSGRIKMFVLRTLLRLRRAQPDFFQSACYEPVEVTGVHAKHVVAFFRSDGTSSLLVAVPRLTAALGFMPVGDAWAGEIRLREGAGTASWSSVFTRKEIPGRFELSRLFKELPFAVLWRANQ